MITDTISFLKPLYLYLLFLIPLLLLLYMLRLKRKIQVVSSCILWEQDIEDIKANTPFQRLRKNILLPLQILFLILVIFALGRPFWQIEGEAAENIILIIDGSASMKANDIEPSRFEAAKSTAIKMIEELGDERRMMIIEAKTLPKIAVNLTKDKMQLRKVIDKMSPTDALSDLENAIRLALSIAEDVKRSSIVILSDGVANLSDELEKITMEIQFVSFGKKDSDNVGITAFEVERSSSEPSKIQAFIALENFGSMEKQNISLELYHDANLIDIREFSLSSKERRSFVFDRIDYAEGVLKATIDVNDNLIADNSAYHILREDKPSKILLVSKGNLFIQEAIKSFSNVEFTYQDLTNYPIEKGYDLIILDNFIPKELPSKNLMLINPEENLPYGKLLSKTDKPKIIDWDRDNPIMRFVDLSNLSVDKSFNYEMPSWMQPLAESDMGTLIWTGENAGNRLIILPFEIRPGISNNFPLLSTFPIFMANAINWLLDSENGYSQRQFRTGKPLKINMPEALLGQNINIKKPNGHEEKFQINDRIFVFDDTDEVGVYSITGDDFSRKFAINLLDESESNIEPKEKLQLGNQELASSTIAITRTRELWSILILIALVILSVEWWAYHRRVLVG